MRTLSAVPTTYSSVQICLCIRDTSLYRTACWVPVVSSIEWFHCTYVRTYVHTLPMDVYVRTYIHTYVRTYSMYVGLCFILGIGVCTSTEYLHSCTHTWPQHTQASRYVEYPHKHKHTHALYRSPVHAYPLYTPLISSWRSFSYLLYFLTTCTQQWTWKQWNLHVLYIHLLLLKPQVFHLGWIQKQPVIQQLPSVRHTDEAQQGRNSCLWLFQLFVGWLGRQSLVAINKTLVSLAKDQFVLTWPGLA